MEYIHKPTIHFRILTCFISPRSEFILLTIRFSKVESILWYDSLPNPELLARPIFDDSRLIQPMSSEEDRKSGWDGESDDNKIELIFEVSYTHENLR